jgi:hypothetical protein
MMHCVLSFVFLRFLPCYPVLVGIHRPFESRVFIENWKWVSKGCGSYLWILSSTHIFFLCQRRGHLVAGWEKLTLIYHWSLVHKQCGTLEYPFMICFCFVRSHGLSTWTVLCVRRLCREPIHYAPLGCFWPISARWECATYVAHIQLPQHLAHAL